MTKKHTYYNVRVLILTLSCIYCIDYRSAIFLINKNVDTKSHFDKKVIYDMDVYELISIAACDKAMPNVAYL